MKSNISGIAPKLMFISSVFFMLTVPVFADLGDTTLSRGMVHPDVAVLQEKLHILGYFESEEFINNFGPKTEAALKAFQKDNGLKVDGIAGKDTFRVLNLKAIQAEILPEDFEPIGEGDKGDKVVDIQKKLRDLGFFQEEVNSIYDQDTVEAVINFQKANALHQTGIVDSATFIKLNTSFDEVIAKRASESRSLIASKLVEYAKQFLGTPYRWGASSGEAFDCSGFTSYIMKNFNVHLDRTASGQYSKGKKVRKEDLQAGDLVFFSTYKKGPSHVGIYIGNNKFIHASSGADKVTITDLDEKYYKQRYVGAVRYDLSVSK